jgi:hypothetical protein
MGETCPMICMRSIFDIVSVALSAAHASGVWFQFLPFSKLGVLGFRGVWWAAVVVGWGLIKRDAPHGPVTPVHVLCAPSFTMGEATPCMAVQRAIFHMYCLLSRFVMFAAERC